MRTLITYLLAVAFVFQGRAMADTTSTNAPTLRKTAIIVENHAGMEFNDDVPVLEDMVGNRIAGGGFSVLSREVVTRALHNYSSSTSPNGQPGSVDRKLEDNTSALRLAQNLGADFILVPSIMTFGHEKKTYNGNGIATVNTTYTLRVGYKIVEAGAGGAISGGTVTATKTVRDTSNLSVESSEVINGLLDDAAGQLADAILKQADSLPTAVAKDSLVKFRISCTMTDPRQSPILIPAPDITADQHLATNEPVAVQPLDVTVELDGAVVGSAPGNFQARPGFHKLRLTREGFDAWERTINVYDGEHLRVALQMRPEEYARLKDTTDFLATLDANRKMSDAEVQRVEDAREYLKNNHYSVEANNGEANGVEVNNVNTNSVETNGADTHSVETNSVETNRVETPPAPTETNIDKSLVETNKN